VPARLDTLLREQWSRNPDLTVRLWVKAVVEALDGIRLETEEQEN
jgi:hypothetical protein